MFYIKDPSPSLQRKPITTLTARQTLRFTSHFTARHIKAVRIQQLTNDYLHAVTHNTVIPVNNGFRLWDQRE